MKVIANYIKSIEIDSLWNGQKHVMWHLKPDVNILKLSSSYFLVFELYNQHHLFEVL